MSSGGKEYATTHLNLNTNSINWSYPNNRDSRDIGSRNGGRKDDTLNIVSNYRYVNKDMLIYTFKEDGVYLIENVKFVAMRQDYWPSYNWYNGLLQDGYDGSYGLKLISTNTPRYFQTHNLNIDKYFSSSYIRVTVHPTPVLSVTFIEVKDIKTNKPKIRILDPLSTDKDVVNDFMNLYQFNKHIESKYNMRTDTDTSHFHKDTNLTFPHMWFNKDDNKQFALEASEDPAISDKKTYARYSPKFTYFGMVPTVRIRMNGRNLDTFNIMYDSVTRSNISSNSIEYNLLNDKQVGFDLVSKLYGYDDTGNYDDHAFAIIAESKMHRIADKYDSTLNNVYIDEEDLKKTKKLKLAYKKLNKTDYNVFSKNDINTLTGTINSITDDELNGTVENSNVDNNGSTDNSNNSNPADSNTEDTPVERPGVNISSKKPEYASYGTYLYTEDYYDADVIYEANTSNATPGNYYVKDIIIEKTRILRDYDGRSVMRIQISYNIKKGYNTKLYTARKIETMVLLVRNAYEHNKNYLKALDELIEEANELISNKKIPKKLYDILAKRITVLYMKLVESTNNRFEDYNSDKNVNINNSPNDGLWTPESGYPNIKDK